MSLGWLTESSLIPKEPKPIEGVGTASLINLQAAVYERERRGVVVSAKRKRQLLESAENDGIEARRKRDEQAAASRPSLATSSAALQAKARRYEALMAGKEKPDAEGLVDFVGKRGVEDTAELDDTMPATAPVSASRRQGAAVPPPRCLASSSERLVAAQRVGTPCPSRRSTQFTVEGTTSGNVGKMLADYPPSAPEVGTSAFRSDLDGGVRQVFERRLLSAEEVAEANRLHEETQRCRDTVGQERRDSRDAIRSRLAALRAEKQRRATDSEAESIVGAR